MILPPGLVGYTRLGLVCYVIASVSQRSNPLKNKRLLRQKAPRNDCNFNPKQVYNRRRGKKMAAEKACPSCANSQRKFDMAE
jgi:hypothetical protein